MGMPERGTGEWISTQERIGKRFMDFVTQIGEREQLPPWVYILIHDEISGGRFGAFADIYYSRFNRLKAEITQMTYEQIPQDITTVSVVGKLVLSCRNMPLLCDIKTANVIRQKPHTWDGDGNYQLEGLGGRVFNVYTPQTGEEFPGEESIEKEISLGL